MMSGLRVSGYILLVLALALVLPCHAQSLAPQLVSAPGITGRLERFSHFPATQVPARHVDVWLPPGYERDTERRYPVLYMHDGQNVFDPETSYAKVDWNVDAVLTRLIDANEVQPAIVVAIWNTPRRVQEYMPQRAVQHLKKLRVPGRNIRVAELSADRYLAFIVTELKPVIDRTYRTQPDRANTLIMGSSMGGLISQYAMSRYPEVFGTAGCVSTHWPIADGITLDDFAAHLPDPGTHRYWFDFGTETLDATYEPFQRRADEILKRAGFREGENWVTRKFEGADHSEAAWQARVDQVLRFLLRPH